MKQMTFFTLFFIIFLIIPPAYGLEERELSSVAFHDLIVQAAARHDVEPELIMAMIMVESSYNSTAVSDSGALGLMQLMPKTAQALGVEDCFDPKENINGGVRYLQRLKKQFKGNIVLALAAYHAGPTRVRRYGGIQKLGSTRQYIMKVMELYQYYKRTNELIPLTSDP